MRATAALVLDDPSTIAPEASPSPGPPQSILPEVKTAEGTTATRGRPSRFSSRVVSQLVHLTRTHGIAPTRAGLMLGIPSSTMSRWRHDNPEFADDLEAARIHFELPLLEEIRTLRKKDGTRDWRASAWILERTNPEVYGRTATRPCPECRRVAQNRTAVAPRREPCPAHPESDQVANDAQANEDHHLQHPHSHPRLESPFRYPLAPETPFPESTSPPCSARSRPETPENSHPTHSDPANPEPIPTIVPRTPCPETPETSHPVGPFPRVPTNFGPTPSITPPTTCPESPENTQHDPTRSSHTEAADIDKSGPCRAEADIIAQAGPGIHPLATSPVPPDTSPAAQPLRPVLRTLAAKLQPAAAAIAAALPRINPPPKPSPVPPTAITASIFKPARVPRPHPPRREFTPAEWARIHQAFDEAPPISSSEDDPAAENDLRDHLTSHGMWTGR